jgi:hypothetical protein
MYMQDRQKLILFFVKKNWFVTFNTSLVIFLDTFPKLIMYMKNISQDQCNFFEI